MNIIIVGSGAVAAELTSYIDDNNEHSRSEKISLLGYLDSKENEDKYWAKYKLKKPVLGDVESYEIKEDDNFLIGIADIKFRHTIIGILQKRNARIAGFIHYSSIVSETAQLGLGNIIYPFCIIGPNCILGDFNLITGYSYISHDCAVGNNNFFSTAGLSGKVTIGNNNFFGMRSAVIPQVVLGSNNVIQAGMILDKNVEDNAIIFHRFKERITIIEKE